VSSITLEDRQKRKKLDAEIRTQGLVGVLLLLTTLGAMIYQARTADVNGHKGIADTALVAFENAKADLQSLFDGKDLEHNLMLLKRRMTFGSDFVPAWMIFIIFLHRVLTKSRPGARRSLLNACLILLATLGVNAFLTSALAAADHQAVLTDATLNGIYFDGQLKWMFLFLDAFLCGLYLFNSPLILRIGAVILTGSSAIGMASVAIPFGLLIPYCVLGLFIAFSGIGILLLFSPQLLYTEKSKVLVRTIT